MTKSVKNIFLWLLAAAAALLFFRCGHPDPVVPGDPAVNFEDISLYEAFRTQFDAGRAMDGFLIEGSGRYKVFFNDGRNRSFGETEVQVAVCTADAWPAVKPKNGVWYVDGKSTGISYSNSRDGEKIVLVMYDGEGLYVRLSSGYIFFFHEGAVREIGCFRFEKALNPSLREDVVCTVSGTAIKGKLDPVTTVFDLIATVGARGTIISSGKNIYSSVTTLNYSKDVSLILEKSAAGSTVFRVAIASAGRLPALYINTGNVSKSSIPLNNYIDATMRLYNPDGLYSDQLDQTFTMQIHGRGNSTWGMPKKPYKIKLTDKTRLLGMSDSRHWVLLANYSDKSLLRNALAFKLSELAGMQWAVRSRPVDVYFNGTYEGLYQLAEHVRVGSERVELDLVGAADNTGSAVTGGYFLWIDEKALYNKGMTGFTTARGLPVVFEEPETLTTQQRSYIENFIKQTELDIYNLTFEQYSEIIDIDSFIRYFFVHELAKNVDGNMRLSTYMTKPRGGRLGFPCVWDFDIAFGNCDYNTGYTGWYIRDAIWFRQLFRNDKFVARVTELWRVFYPKLAEAEAEMRATARLMDDAQKRNFAKWPILGVYVWPNVNAGSRTTYQQELDYMLKFLNDRAAWMNTEILAGRHKKTN